MGARIELLAGQRFTRLAIMELAGKSKKGEMLWRCRCDCGNETIVSSSYLRTGHTRSCGCLVTENVAPQPFPLRHGQSYGVEHRAWRNMRHRCSNPKHKQFPDYGGRGIWVCPRWESFEAFFADMGPRPGPDYSIDRIDNDGPYEPGNCRWATRSEQIHNRRTTQRIAADRANYRTQES